jgi:glc operon protein GlcG
MRKNLAVLLLTAGAMVVPALAAAQAAPPAPPRQNIDLASAKKMAAATVAAAQGDPTYMFATAIVDANGDLVYFERMDGASAGAVTSAVAKARAVILFGVPTRVLQESVAAGKPVSASITAPPRVGAQEILLIQGGLPVMKDGKLIAAIAVGGAKTSPTDEKFAQAGIDAVFPK